MVDWMVPNWIWASKPKRETFRQMLLRQLRFLPVFFFAYLLSTVRPSTARRAGTIFDRGGSKSRGPHFEESTNLLQMKTKTLLDRVSEYNIILLWCSLNKTCGCYRKIFLSKEIWGGQNTMFDPQGNFWGSLDPPDPTVPAPLSTVV